jgi:hypothetical protein
VVCDVVGDGVGPTVDVVELGLEVVDEYAGEVPNDVGLGVDSGPSTLEGDGVTTVPTSLAGLDVTPMLASVVGLGVAPRAVLGEDVFITGSIEPHPNEGKMQPQVDPVTMAHSASSFATQSTPLYDGSPG